MNVLIGNILVAIGSLIQSVINIYVFILIIRIILSWMNISYYSNQIAHFVYIITEPFLSFFRRFIPMIRIGNTYIDLSPIIGFLLLQFISIVIGDTFTTWGYMLKR